MSKPNKSHFKHIKIFSTHAMQFLSNFHVHILKINIVLIIVYFSINFNILHIYIHSQLWIPKPKHDKIVIAFYGTYNVVSFSPHKKYCKIRFQLYIFYETRVRIERMTQKIYYIIRLAYPLKSNKLFLCQRLFNLN